MRKRKHTNGCLLRLLSFCASLSFLLLAGLFGLYYISEKPDISGETETKLEVSKQEVSGGLEMDEDIREAISEEVQEEQKDLAYSSDQDDLHEQENSLSSKEDEGSLEGLGKELGEKIESVAEEGDLFDTSLEVIKDFQKVSVYDSYVLSLDEDIVNKMGDMYKGGQIDYKSVVSKLFSKLSFSDQLRLLNIILSKAQTININEVWNMINDGINEEESIKLQEMVQANFTKEELDELYMYYQSIEIADNE